MSLFSIQRFDSAPTDNVQSKEESILQELHRRAASKAKVTDKSEPNYKKRHKPLQHGEQSPGREIPAKKRKQESLTDSYHRQETISLSSKKTSQTTQSKDYTLKDEYVESSDEDSDTETDSESISETENKQLQKDQVTGKGVSKDNERIDIETERDVSDVVESEKSDDEEGGSHQGDSEERKPVENDGEKKTDSKPKGQVHQDIGGFTVIGEVTKKWKEQVQRVLPEWLARPSVVEADIREHQTPLSAIQGLDDDILAKLRENNITSFFPVQAQVIPALLDGAKSGFLSGPLGYRPPDLCCSAATGSGKTLAFVIPIVQTLKHRVRVQVRALVILPTRDLANQVFKVLETFTSGTSLRVALIDGQKNFAREQESLVRRGPRGFLSLVDIMVATPGRLVDHINKTEGFTLQHLRFLVIDEADRVMQEIQQDWLGAVERSVKAKHTPLTVAQSHHPTCFQKLLFSATLSQNPERLQQLNLFQPKLFTSAHQQSEEINSEDILLKNKTTREEFIGKYTTPAGLTEYYITCTPAEKALILLYYVHHLRFKQVLCFTNSVQSAHRLCWLINLIGGIEVREVTRNLAAKKRARILKQFAAGEIQMLICSDAIARGIDIENVKCVVSYETTRSVDMYVHRVGRTARAGKAGIAITLLETKEVYHFKQLVKQAGKTGVKELKIVKNNLNPYVSCVQDALAKLPDILKAEKKK